MGHLSDNRTHTPTRKAFLRFWALLLSFVTVFSLVPPVVSTGAAEAPKLRISVDGAELDDIYMTTRERVVLEARGAEEGSAYQWQILHPQSDSSWISIYDGIRQELSVTMALAKNMLRADGTVQLRCRATAGDAVIYSDPVTVHISEPQPAQTVAVSSEPAAQDTLSGAEGDENIPEFVTVTIQYNRYDYMRDNNGDLVVDGEGNYVLEYAGEAFLPYIATLQGGNPLKDTVVTNPTMVGYTPFYNGAPSESITLDFDSVTKNELFIVDYRPSEVDYSVRYYLQNVYDDMYVEDASMYVTAKGYTGTTPPQNILGKEKEGFTALYYQPDFIAADGSTVFEVYYERDYYLMEFDCDGGYGTETLYIRYGSYISVPQPVKPGYVFAGWDQTYYTETFINSEGEKEDRRIDVANGVKDDLPETLPAYNSGYKAIWNTTDTTYTVVYWAENANDGHYSYWGYSNVTAQSSTTLTPLDVAKNPGNSAVNKGLENAQYFTLNEAKTVAENPTTVIVEGDKSTIVNVYYSRNTYTLEFALSGKCLLDEHTHSESCYQYYCSSHVHTAACYTCGKVDHIHTGTCCTLTEHPSHTIACYTNNTDYTVISDDDDHMELIGNIDNPQAGTVYRYRYYNWGTRYANYFYDGVDWYYLGSESGAYCGINCGAIDTPTANNTYRSGKATMICTTPLHTHGTGCNYGCSLEPHAHTPSCFLCGTTEHIHNGACCSIKEHQSHTIACYTNGTGYSVVTGGDNLTRVNTISNPIAGYVYRYRTGNYNATYYNYLYDGTTWYLLGTGGDYEDVGHGTINNPPVNTAYSAAATLICTTPLHTHGTGCNYSSCTIPAHAHTGDCFNCGQHHIHSALCDRHRTCTLIEHVHTSTCQSNSANNLVYVINAKFQQDIRSHFPITASNGTEYAGYRWQVPSGSTFFEAGNNILALDSMPGESLRFTSPSNGKGATVWYYTETLSGNGVHEHDGRYFDLYKSVVMPSNGNLTKAEEFHDITGFTQWQSDPDFGNRDSVGKKTNNYMYYIRNTYTVEFHNYNARLDDKKTSKKYQESLSDLYFVPNYPNDLEPGAYEFGGWYSTDGCYPGTEFDFNTTMPASSIVIYAKWTPILRNVTFYSTYDDMVKNATPFLSAKDVPHGELLGSAYNQQPTAKEGYRFIGWFYMDDDNKKRFAPDSMEITRDLELFAEWTTTIDTTYEVTYVLAGDIPGTDYKKGDVIADAEFNHITVGKTKTFQAKGGTQLYPAFRKSIFPVTNSHSILMKESAGENTFAFEYVYDSEVWYKVQYLDYQTRTPLADEKVEKTQEAIVTEKFKPIKGRRPTGFYITQALASDGDGDGTNIPEENILTFLYVKDEDHGMFSIEHYLENIDSTDSANRDNYTLYEYDVGSSDVGKTVSGTPRTYTGFTHNPALNLTVYYEITDNGDDPDTITEKESNALSGTVTYAGLTIKIYYSRKNYPYIIEYREHGVAETADPLKRLNASGADVSKTDQLPRLKYDSELTHTAEEGFTLNGINYEYYIPDSTEEQRTRTTDIRVATDDSPNKLIFYYTKKKIPVLYHAVCTEKVASGIQFGAVSIASESAASAETLGGSTPLPASGFVFMGWYEDEACTVPVDENWVDKTKGSILKPEEFTLEEGQDEDHYYALFAPVTRDLKIVKEGVTSTTDSFLFSITGTNALGQDVELTVSIQGSGEVTVKDLYCGTYTVTELTGWSWNYTCAAPSQEVTLTVEETGVKTVTFQNTYQQPDWLTDEARAENQFS